MWQLTPITGLRTLRSISPGGALRLRQPSGSYASAAPLGATPSALTSVGFMVAWPSSGAAEGGVVAETTDARYITPW